MQIVALAFSGGLDTSYCVPRLAQAGAQVHTVYVNTGGATTEECAAIRRQAEAVGSVQHHEVDAREHVYQRFVRYLVQGVARVFPEIRQARIIGTYASGALRHADKPQADAILSAMRGDPFVGTAEVFYSDGKPLARFARVESGDAASASDRSVGSVTFSSPRRLSTRPWRLRSSGTKPTPARIASAGERRPSGMPATSTRSLAS